MLAAALSGLLEQCATEERPVRIFLDAIDALAADSDSARPYGWLPKETPEQAVLLVSVGVDSTELIGQLVAPLDEDEVGSKSFAHTFFGGLRQDMYCRSKKSSRPRVSIRLNQQNDRSLRADVPGDALRRPRRGARRHAGGAGPLRGARAARGTSGGGRGGGLPPASQGSFWFPALNSFPPFCERSLLSQRNGSADHSSTNHL